MMKFKVKSGSYTEAGRVYGTGDTIITMYELDKMFGSHKYQRLSGEVQKEPVKPATPPQNAPINNDTAPNQIQKGEDPRGVCKNDLFEFDPKATELSVFLKDKLYFVYDDSNREEPLNKEGLRKRDVEDFIDSQCE